MDKNYILSRLRSDSRHVSELAAIDGQIGHPGVKGRFRELLVNNLLLPWLPPSVGCGTGVIIDHHQGVSKAGQDDIILFDSLLAPSVLASSQSTHGVYLFDSVLCRVEVKSKLTKEDLGSFVETSQAISGLELALKTDQAPQLSGAFNMLMGFGSELSKGQELQYLHDAMTQRHLDPGCGIVSAMCIAECGFWPLGEEAGVRRWKELQFTDAADPLAYFVGVISNSCFDQRAARQGLQPLGGGIGMYIDHPFKFV